MESNAQLFMRKTAEFWMTTKMNMSAHIKTLLDTSGESRYHKSAPSFAHMYSHVFKRVANRFRDFN